MPFLSLNENNRILLRPVLYLLTALEGVYAFHRLLQVPRDPQGGMSTIVSILLLVFTAILTLVLLGLAYFTWRRPQQTLPWFDSEHAPRRLRIISLAALAVIPLSIITHVVLHSLFTGTQIFLYRLVYSFLDPFLLWAGLAAAQWWLWLALNHPQPLKAVLQKRRSTFRTALLVWALFLLLAWVVRAAGLRVPETSMTGWAIPSVPLLEWHIWLSGLIAALFFVLEKRATHPASTAKLRLISRLRSDRFWFFLIWGISLALWAAQPLLTSHYATPGRPPNFEVYPFSDGMFYDQTAQSILIGNGMMGDEIPARPLYTVFLAILHGLAGQEYQQVILVQTIVLAFFPAVLYLLGKEFGSRPAGIMMALLTILRETHSIQAAPFTRSVSNVKLYFSEVPTALGLSLFLLFAIRWLKNRENPGANPLLAGGMLGITMLIRTQSLAVLPFVLLLGLLAAWPSWKKTLVRAALLVLTLAVTVAPWLWRNYQITGAFVFDNPLSQTWEMANRYARVFEEDPSLILDRRTGENDGDFSRRLNKYILEAIVSHPDYAFQTIGTNLANGELSSLLVLPVRPLPLHSARELLRSETAFWEAWPQEPSTGMALLLTLNMGLIALGIGAGWQRLGWAGFIPLSMNVMYNLATAVFQVSGMRFVLPVQWVAYFYFSLGCVVLMGSVWAILTGRARPAPAETATDPSTQMKHHLKWPQAVLVMTMFALAGSSLLLSEKIVPKRFLPQTQAQILAELVEIPAIQQDAELLDLLNNLPIDGGPQILKGRALYPRYYAQDEIEPDTAKTAYATLFYPRVVFYFLSEEINQVAALPVADIPQHFPHPTDMILVGCPQGLMIEARLVVPLDGANVVYTSNLVPIDTLCKE